ncbi:hypothetical protein B0T24DRAFT_535083 [Lasiosphaeria ovina]|uniref:Uncharacterized protein n=1 Tax=Lasiosphaeria ovina TaxID=92902 RepID=A0AAE0N139_9PEZI|nr:hypothetical protein B0T24DRAFT_535083 [Lasiosphaeria ovina]
MEVPAAGTDDTSVDKHTEPEAADVDSVEDLSVATEMKFLLRLTLPREPEADRSRTEDERQALLQEQTRESVAATIRATGQAAATVEAIKGDGLEERQVWASHWIVKRANSASPQEAEQAEQAALLSEDNSHYYYCYTWIPVELCSPRMRLRDPSTHERIAQALAALSAEHTLVANYTCEVHVHVGRMDGRPFALPTLQRLATLLWLAEPTLRSIRDPASPNYHNVFTWGAELRRQSRLAQAVLTAGGGGGGGTPSSRRGRRTGDAQVDSILASRPAEASPRDAQALELIWGAATHGELGRLLSGPGKQFRRLGFNFSAFGREDARARTNPRTVEFRIMEGTPRADLVLGWLAVCGAVAEAAALRSDERFRCAASRLLLLPPLADEDGGEDEDGVRPGEGVEPMAAEEEGDRAWGVRSGGGRALAFRELMQDLQVPRATYVAFEDKIAAQWAAAVAGPE